jgi:hypothetical protein
MLRYKLAIAGMLCVSERRYAGADSPHTVVEWVLVNGARLTYFFDSMFPDDYVKGGVGVMARDANSQTQIPNLRTLLPQVQTLVMKGFIPKPAKVLLACLPFLKRVYSTEDNYVSLIRGLREQGGEKEGIDGSDESFDADVTSEEGLNTVRAVSPPAPSELDNITVHIYPEFEVRALQEAAEMFEDSWDATNYTMHLL